MRLGACVFAVLAIGLVGPVAPAQADPEIDKAKAALDASDYPAARTQAAALIARGTNGPEDLAELYRLSGIAAGAQGDAKAAQEAFERCLALTPKASLPAGTSPKITRPFVAAQGTAKTPLKIKADPAPSPPSVTLAIVDDPFSMVARFRVLARVDGKAEQAFEKPAADSITVGLPEGARIDLWVVALDEHGNRVAEVGSKDVPLVIVGKATSPVIGDGKVRAPPRPVRPAEPARARPLYLQWWLWGGVTVAVGGLSGYFGYRAISGRNELRDLTAASPNHTFDEARDVESRTRRDVLITNISLGATGVFGVAAAILFLTRPHPPATERSTATIGPVPIPHGGALVVEGSF